jgi:hypothetical protein
VYSTTSNKIPQIIMAKSKTKTTQEYIEELKTSIQQKTGSVLEPWLMPMLRTTAMNMVILDRIQEKLEEEDMTSSMQGSMGQQKIEVNPLIDKYNNTVNTLIKLFKALGLSYDTASGKIASADDGDNDDPVLAALKHK